MKTNWAIGFAIAGTALVMAGAFGLAEGTRALSLHRAPKRIEECRALCLEMRAPHWSWTQQLGCRCGDLP